MSASAVSTYPVAIDPLVQPQADDFLDDIGVEHDLIHDWVNDAIRQIETKLGISSSVDTGSIDYKMRNHQHNVGGVGGTSLAPTTLAATGAVSGSTLSSTGAITGGSLAVTNAITGASVATTGNVGGATLSATGAISGASLSLTTPLPIASGGTGSITKNFVDLTTAQTVAGVKTFSSAPIFSAPLGIASGGTGSITQNFVDLTTNQNVSGVKTFLARPIFTSPVAGTSAWFTDSTSSSMYIRHPSSGILQLDTDAGNSFQFAHGGTGMMTIGGTGIMSATAQPGTTHESNRVDGSSQMYGRGFTYASDGATHQGAITAGVSISVNRSTPALALNNSSGPPLRLYSAATLLAEFFPNPNMSFGDWASVGFNRNVTNGAIYNAAHNAWQIAGGGTFDIQAYSAAGAATGTFRVGTDGHFESTGTTNTMGAGAFGAANTFMYVGTYDPTYALVAAGHGTSANAGLIIQSKGNGPVILRNGGNTGKWVQFDSNGQMTVYDSTTGLDGISLNPSAGGSSPHGQITIRGDQADIRGVDGAGNTRFLMGLRSDVVGNTTDPVIYTYAGPLRVYTSAGAEHFRVGPGSTVGVDLSIAADILGVGLKRLAVGAVDSAGAGFRTVKMYN